MEKTLQVHLNNQRSKIADAIEKMELVFPYEPSEEVAKGVRDLLTHIANSVRTIPHE